MDTAGLDIRAVRFKCSESITGDNLQKFSNGDMASKQQRIRINPNPSMTGAISIQYDQRNEQHAGISDECNKPMLITIPNDRNRSVASPRCLIFNEVHACMAVANLNASNQHRQNLIGMHHASQYHQQ